MPTLQSEENRCAKCNMKIGPTSKHCRPCNTAVQRENAGRRVAEPFTLDDLVKDTLLSRRPYDRLEAFRLFDSGHRCIGTPMGAVPCESCGTPFLQIRGNQCYCKEEDCKRQRHNRVAEKFRKSEKGRAYVKDYTATHQEETTARATAWARTEKGQASRKAYLSTERGQQVKHEAEQRYLSTEKGRAQHRKSTRRWRENKRGLPLDGDRADAVS